MATSVNALWAQRLAVCAQRHSWRRWTRGGAGICSKRRVGRLQYKGDCQAECGTSPRFENKTAFWKAKWENVEWRKLSSSCGYFVWLRFFCMQCRRQREILVQNSGLSEYWFLSFRDGAAIQFSRSYLALHDSDLPQFLTGMELVGSDGWMSMVSNRLLSLRCVDDGPRARMTCARPTKPARITTKIPPTTDPPMTMLRQCQCNHEGGELMRAENPTRAAWYPQAHASGTEAHRQSGQHGCRHQV